jgi:hypothetical protein
LQRLVEIEIQSHGVVVGVIFRARPAHGGAVTFVHDELQGCGQGSFDGRAVDLAVALHRVRVAGEEQRPVVEHRQIERRTDAELVEIHVAAPARGRPRADETEVARRRHRHDAHERVQRHFEIVGEQRDIAGEIELDDLGRGPQAARSYRSTGRHEVTCGRLGTFGRAFRIIRQGGRDPRGQIEKLDPR